MGIFLKVCLSIHIFLGSILILEFLGPWFGEPFSAFGEWIGEGVLGILYFSVGGICLLSLSFRRNPLFISIPVLFYFLYYAIYGLVAYKSQPEIFLSPFNGRIELAVKAYLYMGIPLLFLLFMTVWAALKSKNTSSRLA